MAENQTDLATMIESQNLLALYGLPVHGMSSQVPTSFAWPSGTSGTYSMIHGAKILEICKKFRPVLLLLPGNGEVLQQEECTFKAPFRKWNVLPDVATIAMSPEVTTVLESLEFGKRGVSVTGGVQFSNPTLQGGQACVDIHFWGKIDADVLFVHIHEHFDDHRHRCISLTNTWITLYSFSIGVVNVALEATYHSHQLCGRIHISLPHGIWDGYLPNEGGACVHVPFAPAVALPACGCESASA